MYAKQTPRHFYSRTLYHARHFVDCFLDNFFFPLSLLRDTTSLQILNVISTRTSRRFRLRDNIHCPARNIRRNASNAAPSLSCWVRCLENLRLHDDKFCSVRFAPTINLASGLRYKAVPVQRTPKRGSKCLLLSSLPLFGETRTIS